MNRLASTLALALVFSIAACGDDDKPVVDSGVDTGTGACTGSFMGATQTQLAGAIAMSTGPKSCAADVAAVCTGNVAQVAGACGLSCLGMTADAATACVTACIKTKLAMSSLTLSDACNGCYAATVVCTQTMCLGDCAADPSAAKCTQCQIDKGCRSTFANCSGLPTGGSPSDGGAGDGSTSSDGGATGDGGTDAAAGDTGAADTAVSSDAAADTAASSDTSTD
jgi:hypothetical protein